MPRLPQHRDVEFTRFPNLPGVELRHSCYRSSVFATHTHFAWSVGTIESGCTTTEIGGRMYACRAGQLVVMPPDCPHACNPDEGDSIGYRMFYLADEWFEDGVEFESAVIDDPELFEQWRTLGEKLAAEPATADATALRSAIDALVARHGVRRTPPEGRPAADTPEAVSAAKQLFRDRLRERVTLEQLAEQVNLSRSHLSRTFSAAEGVPPHVYHNQLRVDRAKELLATDLPLVEVAAEAGFNDQSHLTRVFRQYVGATPAQYRSSVL